jgi:catechol 2,3-dioxygenase-like lactoylglutathione lyase family enzyme
MIGPKEHTEDTMPDLPRWEISHIGIFVTDIEKMRDFYTRVLGFKVMDSGEMKNGQHLTFLSKDPKDHHQIVLVSGRPQGAPSTINQLTFRVPSIKEVRFMHDHLVENKVADIDPVSHGNAWSVYFKDPEGNRLEFFCDTPWYVAQPRRERLDFSLSDKEIEAATYRSIKDDPTTKPFGEWRREKQKEMGLAG